MFGSTIGAARAVASTADGEIVVAGHAMHDFALVRLTATARSTPSFGDGGKVVTAVSATNWDEAKGLALEADGKIVVGGWAYEGNSSSGNFALVRYDDDGELDGGFGDAGIVITEVAAPQRRDEAAAVLLQSDERVPTVRVLLAGCARRATATSRSPASGAGARASRAPNRNRITPALGYLPAPAFDYCVMNLLSSLTRPTLRRLSMMLIAIAPALANPLTTSPGRRLPVIVGAVFVEVAGADGKAEDLARFGGIQDSLGPDSANLREAPIAAWVAIEDGGHSAGDKAGPDSGVSPIAPATRSARPSLLKSALVNACPKRSWAAELPTTPLTPCRHS